MPIHRLRKFLDDKRIKYTVICHSTAYTAQEIAQSAHVSGFQIAKTIVIVTMEGKTALVVLPAPYRINFSSLKEELGSAGVWLASEEEFNEMFPDCETGAMPPFGNLYSLEVYVDKKLTEDKEIAFNACNHRELIKMKYSDFSRLVRPTVLDLTYEPESLHCVQK
jgi:Ala-tRNA(Pro) deacylase